MQLFLIVYLGSLILLNRNFSQSLATNIASMGNLHMIYTWDLMWHDFEINLQLEP